MTKKFPFFQQPLIKPYGPLINNKIKFILLFLLIPYASVLQNTSIGEKEFISSSVHTCISIEKEIIFPATIPSFFRTSAFSDKRYAPAFLSGNIDVFHVVLPIATITGSDPHPRFIKPKRAVISADCFLESITKCHADFPE